MSDSIDRREFGRWLTGGVAAGLTTASATADEPPRKPPLAALALARVMDEFPSEHYDDDAISRILNDIRGDLARGRELSAFPLKNSDEPAFLFPADSQLRLSYPEQRG